MKFLQLLWVLLILQSCTHQPESDGMALSAEYLVAGSVYMREDRALVFHVDDEVWAMDSMTGWVVHPETSLYRDMLLDVESLVGKMEPGLTRPYIPRIGTAFMEPDGTIVQYLLYLEHGVRGEGVVSVSPADEKYSRLLTHLNGLKPGEMKPIFAWSDKPANE